MEYSFNVDLLLPDKISKFNNKLQIAGKRAVITDREKRAQLLMIIDEMGTASAKAQGLNIAVTTGEKFVHSDHVIYLMKDESGDKSVVIGILKMGKKKLFLMNREGTQNETLPLCVLDFYVHESKQRIGCGKQLYDFMLKEENIQPLFLAIDKPSSKFLAFLRKHYGLIRTIPQVNHFTIFEDFFKNKYVTRSKITENEMHENSKTSEKSQHNYPKTTYPYGTTFENDKQCSSTEINTRRMYENESQMLGNSSAPRQSNQFDSPEAAIHGKLTPDGSCASHLLEDSAMKIFGVPSAWMQTSGR